MCNSCKKVMKRKQNNKNYRPITQLPGFTDKMPTRKPMKPIKIKLEPR